MTSEQTYTTAGSEGVPGGEGTDIMMVFIGAGVGTICFMILVMTTVPIVIKHCKRKRPPPTRRTPSLPNKYTDVHVRTLERRLPSPAPPATQCEEDGEVKEEDEEPYWTIRDVMKSEPLRRKLRQEDRRQMQRSSQSLNIPPESGGAPDETDEEACPRKIPDIINRLPQSNTASYLTIFDDGDIESVSDTYDIMSSLFAGNQPRAFPQSPSGSLARDGSTRMKRPAPARLYRTLGKKPVPLPRPKRKPKQHVYANAGMLQKETRSVRKSRTSGLLQFIAGFKNQHPIDENERLAKLAARSGMCSQKVGPSVQNKASIATSICELPQGVVQKISMAYVERTHHQRDEIHCGCSTHQKNYPTRCSDDNKQCIYTRMCTPRAVSDY